MRQNQADTEVKCKHGHVGYCELCSAEAAPKCKHGNPFYCGFCLAETGDGIVRSQKGEPSK